MPRSAEGGQNQGFQQGIKSLGKSIAASDVRRQGSRVQGIARILEGSKRHSHPEMDSLVPVHLVVNTSSRKPVETPTGIQKNYPLPRGSYYSDVSHDPGYFPSLLFVFP